MKANKMAVAPAAAISFDEFIFQEKNHLYGAYKLRKEYKKRLLVALFFMSILLASAISLPYIMKFFDAPAVIKPIEPITPTIEITPYEDIVPPAPPAPEPPQDLMRQIATNIFQVVDSTYDPNPEIAMLEPDEIGGIDENHGLMEYREPETNQATIPNEDSIYNSGAIQEKATFEGGDINNFGKWVGQNLNVDRISETNLTGKVGLQFIIDKTGNITNLKVTRSFNNEVDQEILRTIENAPKKWTPGRQNGNAVKQLIYMSILVKIES